MTFIEGLQLFERLVKAIEIIADIKSGGTQHLQTAGAPIPVKLMQQDMNPESYEALVTADKREALLELCKERNIVVPPRTKTPTLAKLLTEWDKQNPAGPTTAESTENGGTEGGGTEGGGTEGGGTEGGGTEGGAGAETTNTDDPLGSDPLLGNGTQEVELTLQDLLDVLQPVQTAKGSPFVRDILVKYGQVESLGALAKENFKAVYDAAKAVK